MSGAFWAVFALLTLIIVLLAAGIVRGNVYLRRRPRPRNTQGTTP